ncbi:MAG: glycosyltransferase family 2 protein [Desulfobulbaceae bacterium]|nr:glycosyltransferase family 2 protein [Desulfobulbaceae bacterium]MDP2105305.1 glycosyltransferase family 2 protein [Desulfobulbaceae bacterium]
MKNHHVAVVILNYNSEKDLQICAEQISKQEGVHLSTILVDNASRTDSLQAIKSWLIDWRPDAVSGPENEVQSWVRQHQGESRKNNTVYLIENHENRGYSAGNNIGIRLANTLGANAVLIANPDMRIVDRNYLRELTVNMFSDPHCYVAGSRILSQDGVDQNPLREASFLEEFFWPRCLFRRFGVQKSYVIPCPIDKSSVAPKVSGCCLMLRMDFLRDIGFLDEGVFLYCEEPILVSMVHRKNGKILYVPSAIAIHAHVKSEKGDSTKRMLQFIRSRKYYLYTYAGYQKWQLWLLSISYKTLALYSISKGLITRAKTHLLVLRKFTSKIP